MKGLASAIYLLTPGLGFGRRPFGESYLLSRHSLVPYCICAFRYGRRKASTRFDPEGSSVGM